MEDFAKILAQESIFQDRSVLSPHYLPEKLLHREKEIGDIMRAVAPALRGEKPKNLFLYGKTGTGKTSCTKWVLEKLAEEKKNAVAYYLNCRIYNTRYRVLHKIMSDFLPDCAKPGYGIAFIYEKLLDWVEGDGKQFIVVLDEIDMVKDLDDLVYALTRSNDDIKKGGISLIGISNQLSFKEKLDARSKSALYENEMVFSPYTSLQLAGILRQRAEKGFKKGCVDESAVNLSAAIAAQETGDARYALKLLLKAGEIAAEENAGMVKDQHVEKARKAVEEDIVVEAITTLPEHQQLVLNAIAHLTLSGGRYSKLGDDSEKVLLTGEVHEVYERACKKLGRDARSSRWYKEYLSDLEMLGLIETKESGKGIRGRTRLIRLCYPAEKVKKILDKTFGAEAV